MEALISNAWFHMSADKDIRLNLAVRQTEQSMPEKKHSHRLYYLTSYFSQGLFELT